MNGWIVLLAALAAAPEWVLTRDAEKPFNELMTAAEHGELGPDVKTVDVGINGAQARVTLSTTSGEKLGFTLSPPEGLPGSPRFFTVQPDAGVSAGKAHALTALIDRVFVTSPWLHTVDDTPKGDPSGGAVGHWFTTPVGRGYMKSVLMLLFVAMSVMLVSLWRVRP